MRPSALTRRASTTSSASSGSRSPARSRSSSGRRTRPPRRPPTRRDGRSPARGLPPSSRSSACASTVLPAPVSPVRTFRPGPEAQLGPLDQQQVLDTELFQHVGWSTTGVRRSGPCAGRFGAEPARSCCRARLGWRNEPGGEQKRLNGGHVRSRGKERPRVAAASSGRVAQPHDASRVDTRAAGTLPLPYEHCRCPRTAPPAHALGACQRAPGPRPSEPAARTAPAAGGRSSPPAAARARRTRARTRRGCPPPPAARTPGGRPRGPRRPPRATRC